jgi:hypothetical protein
MRALLSALVMAGAVHCRGKGHDVPAPAASASGSVAAAPRQSAVSGAKATPASVGLPAVDFGPPGPIVIEGYPAPLELGMRDYATMVGWAKDGSVLACGHLTPMGGAKGAELADTCYREKAGKTERATVEESASGPFVGGALAEQLKQLREGGPITLKKTDSALLPPPVVASWPFARDLTLVLDEVARKDDSVALRIGGSASGREAVHPVTVTLQGKIPEITYRGAWNAVLANEKELAFIGHFFCAEWCNELVITRLSFGKLASLVYNDSGFRLHQKKDYAGSRDLFLKATWADPEAPLPPYNLACAYALLGDEKNAERALNLAVSLGGAEVKSRARKDADFAAVSKAKWFETATSG